MHCGADNGKHPVTWENKAFCCNGCKQVYQLLNESKLNQYYNFEETPGIKVDVPTYDQKYAYLDREDIKDQYFEFYQDNIAKVTFYIPGIHCASCIWLLEHLHKLNKGVKHATVNFIKKEYTVSFNTNEISLRQLVELLASIHYIPDLSVNKNSKLEEIKESKSLLYKIGLAGFVFGNVMLYSLPEYFNGEPIGDSIGQFLYYLTYVLTIPLVFYSGSDYLVSAFKNLSKKIINIDLPIAMGILALFFVTSYEVLRGNGPGYSDSLSGFLFFLLIGRWYQSKTYQALSFDRDYKSYFPVSVTKLNKGKEESILLSEIGTDDELLIHNKELIPADGVITKGIALIDYSFVTGESTPVKRNPGELIYAGGIQTSGSIQVKVNKEVKQSHLTQLWNQSKKNRPSKRSLTSIIDTMSIYFTVAVIIIALSGFLYWIFNGSLNEAILVLTSVLIVACPCALALSLPFTFGNTMRVLGTKGMYIKNTSVIEKLTKINTIVFDKTGTITIPDNNKIVFNGEALSTEQKQIIASVAKQSVHPLSSALAKYFNDTEKLATEGFTEMSGKGIFAYINGKEVKLGSANFVTNNSQSEQKINSSVHVSIANNYLGYFEISNQYRNGFNRVINNLSKQFDIHLLSGDNNSEEERLSKFFQTDNMHFNQQPMDKMNYIDWLHKQNKTVLMTGDGLNDAGAFMQSDVALSIADDIYHFSPAGDAIVEASKFHLLPQFIKYAQKSLLIVRLSFIISLFYNIIGLGFALSGNLSPVVAAILMPISSVSVVAFATFSTRALGRHLFKDRVKNITL